MTSGAKGWAPTYIHIFSAGTRDGMQINSLNRAFKAPLIIFRCFCFVLSITLSALLAFLLHFLLAFMKFKAHGVLSLALAPLSVSLCFLHFCFGAVSQTADASATCILSLSPSLSVCIVLNSFQNSCQGFESALRCIPPTFRFLLFFKR
ncbi:hypothetical protein M5D96_000328 [Drosophila gunungcola]|uniref:Uncharacterized protein n=1 Tax=Drosophila gunungcola TaxID=103775 RepID=A0A9Q0BTI7_9MUSC|nr:hypothetical protein M5D96_000328 [Drosophila gunungcola]